MSPPALDPETVDRVVAAALEEDLDGAGDVTTRAVVEGRRRARATIVARETLVVAGIAVAARVFAAVDAMTISRAGARDGDGVHRGHVLLEVDGPARALLTAERTALNFLQRMCGIATAARAAVEEIVGTGATILDTRKTAPGLRALDKYAVACGGAHNHRMGLYDGVLIKDTHLAVAGSVRDAVARATAMGHEPATITVEVASVDQLREALAVGVGRALLDNMDVATLTRCVAIGKGRIVLEASGGLRPGHLADVAATGVDFLSLGSITHSVRAADLAMDLEPLA